MYEGSSSMLLETTDISLKMTCHGMLITLFPRCAGYKVCVVLHGD